MSLNPFNAPLTLSIKPSFQKYALIFIPHVVALLAILFLDVFNAKMRIVLAILICISAAYYYLLHIWQAFKKSVFTIDQDSEKQWFITTPGSKIKKQVQLLHSSFLGQALMVINFIDYEKRVYTVLITKDSLPKATYRHLFVKLKLT